MSTPQRPDHDYQDDDQADAVEPAEPSGPGRTAYRRGAANPNGSTTALRADVLGALGVLKVATADRLQRLLHLPSPHRPACPHRPRSGPHRRRQQRSGPHRRRPCPVSPPRPVCGRSRGAGCAPNGSSASAARSS
ncbi:hypothetical protein AB0A71_39755 [Kitasatospora aureofaciens]|uniref:hypothetical protein n=1 Tax=Kitasatospora aureofaciens TaxID=1894 RepID=UPI0033D10B27